MLTENDMRLFIEDEPSTSDVEVLERIQTPTRIRRDAVDTLDGAIALIAGALIRE
jgi:hypothetical protein